MSQISGISSNNNTIRSISSKSVSNGTEADSSSETAAAASIRTRKASK